MTFIPLSGAEIGTTFHPVFSGSLLRKKGMSKTLSPPTKFHRHPSCKTIDFGVKCVKI